MTYEQLKQIHDQSVMPTYARFPVALVSGRGATAKDMDGKEYIDFGSGIGVNALGYCPEGWLEAVTAQAATLQHISNLYYNDTQILLAKELCAATGMARAFLANSGAEANEGAIKLARKYSFDKYGGDRNVIVSLVNSFHGRTVTTLSATGQDNFHTSFFPFTEGFRFTAAGDIDDLKAKLDGYICGVIVECIQGEGGVVPLDPVYLRAVRQLCDENDVVLIIDEVQTGAGRTGKFLACEHGGANGAAGVKPDVVTMAKGLGGGLPIGAVLCGEKYADVMNAGSHGSTFGGNPVVCAGARYMIKTLSDPMFLSEVTAKGQYFRKKLAAMPHVKDVRGQGLMIGLELDGLDAKTAANACVEAGLLILTAKTLLRLLPPLNISAAETDKGLAILESVLTSM